VQLIPNHEVRIRVLATCAVLGMFAGEEHLVYPTHRVELLIKTGHLIWLDGDDGDGS
jgi:hypothetical protein